MLKSVRGIPSKIRRKRTKSERRNRTKESVVIEEVEAKPHREKLDLLYSIQEDPPWYTCLILGFQHYLTMFGATMAYPLILAIPLCIEDNALVKSDLISTIFFMAGLSTLLQTTFGCRLPIVQGGTYAFLVPAIAILNLEKYKCPEMKVPVNNTDLSTSPPETEITMTESSFMATDTSDVTNLVVSMAVNSNLTQPELIPITLALKGEEVMNWKVRMREIQGAIIVSSLFQVVIGFTGIIGFMLRYIGPLSIAPTIALVGLSLFSTAGRLAGEHWWISCLTFGLLILFSQYLKDVKTPVPAYTRKKGCHVSWWPSFKLFPVLLAIVIAWVLCVILTATDVFPNNKSNWQYGARTDRYREVLHQANWFVFPYPGQWGTPTVSAAGVFGMMAGVIASMIESVGDYYACARLSGAPPPPAHAVNRGIGIEGICCMLAGAWGSGTGTTSYSENIGAIGITKVGSRRVIQWGAVLMLFFSIFGKFGALFTTIPDPIVGGVLAVTFGMVTSVGISNLQFVDLNSSRNLFIIGFSLFLGMALPNWLGSHPGAINTGSQEFDNMLTVLLSTSMFVGGFAGFILDNTIPGTPEERGLLIWRDITGEYHRETEDEDMRCYDLPFGMGKIRKVHWTKYIPFCPTFQDCFRPKRIPESKSADVTLEVRVENEETKANDIGDGITDGVIKMDCNEEASE